jgi:hypothetical protein
LDGTQCFLEQSVINILGTPFGQTIYFNQFPIACCQIRQNSIANNTAAAPYAAVTNLRFNIVECFDHFFPAHNLLQLVDFEYLPLPLYALLGRVNMGTKSPGYNFWAFERIDWRQ